MHPIDLRDRLSCILPFPAEKGPAPWAAGMGQRCVGVKRWAPPELSAPSRASAAHVFLGYRAGSLPSTLFFLGWARKAFLPIAPCLPLSLLQAHLGVWRAAICKKSYIFFYRSKKCPRRCSHLSHLASFHSRIQRRGLCVFEGDMKAAYTYKSFKLKTLNHPLLINDLVFKNQLHR